MTPNKSAEEAAREIAAFVETFHCSICSSRIDFDAPNRIKLTEAILTAVAPVQEELGRVTKERDRLRDTKWKGVTDLETRLSSLTSERDELKKQNDAIKGHNNRVEAENERLRGALKQIALACNGERELVGCMDDTEAMTILNKEAEAALAESTPVISDLTTLKAKLEKIEEERINWLNDDSSPDNDYLHNIGSILKGGVNSTVQPTVQTIRVEGTNKRANELLTSALKWVRMIEERSDEVPTWFRHGADPKPLRKEIESFLKGGV